MIGLDYDSVWGTRGGEEVRKERMRSKKKKEDKDEGRRGGENVLEWASRLLLMTPLEDLCC